MTRYKLIFNIKTTGDLVQVQKFTGKSQMVEAKLGELSTLDQSTPAATATFVLTDAQYSNSASFAAVIPNQDGTQLLTNAIISNMFVNKFAVVKKIEVAGNFVSIASRGASIYNAPLLTIDWYNGHLCTPMRENLVLTAKDFTDNADGGTNVQFGSFFWEGEVLFSPFTNFALRLNSDPAPDANSTITIYFDEVLPVSKYHEYLANKMSWNTGCNGLVQVKEDVTVKVLPQENPCVVDSEIPEGAKRLTWEPVQPRKRR